MDDLFDRDEGERRKRYGMEIAAENAASPLQLAREIAEELAWKHGRVHADMVGSELWQRHGIKTLGPAAGSIFAEKKWKFTGEFIKSARKTNHARRLMIWSL